MITKQMVDDLCDGIIDTFQKISDAIEKGNLDLAQYIIDEKMKQVEYVRKL